MERSEHTIIPSHQSTEVERRKTRKGKGLESTLMDTYLVLLLLAYQHVRRDLAILDFVPKRAQKSTGN